jgi:hypothetical protein
MALHRLLAIVISPVQWVLHRPYCFHARFGSSALLGSCMPHPPLHVPPSECRHRMRRRPGAGSPVSGRPGVVPSRIDPPARGHGSPRQGTGEEEEKAPGAHEVIERCLRARRCSPGCARRCAEGGVSWVPRRADHELCRSQLTMSFRLVAGERQPRRIVPGLSTDPR